MPKVNKEELRDERSRRAPLRALVPGVEVSGLFVRELVDVDVHGGEFEAGDLVVDLLRHGVDLALEAAGVLDRVLGGEGWLAKTCP